MKWDGTTCKVKQRIFRKNNGNSRKSVQGAKEKVCENANFWNPTRVKQPKRVLREIEGMRESFRFERSVLETLAYAFEESFKSFAIPVCLSELWRHLYASLMEHLGWNFLISILSNTKYLLESPAQTKVTRLMRVVNSRPLFVCNSHALLSIPTYSHRHRCALIDLEILKFFIRVDESLTEYRQFSFSLCQSWG